MLTGLHQGNGCAVKKGWSHARACSGAVAAFKRWSSPASRGAAAVANPPPCRCRGMRTGDSRCGGGAGMEISVRPSQDCKRVPLQPPRLPLPRFLKQGWWSGLTGCARWRCWEPRPGRCFVRFYCRQPGGTLSPRFRFDFVHGNSQEVQ